MIPNSDLSQNLSSNEILTSNNLPSSVLGNKDYDLALTPCENLALDICVSDLLP